MRVVIQRVSGASVVVDNQEISSIGDGLLILLGIEEEDNVTDITMLIQKIPRLRIFNDENGKMNLSCSDIDGDYLVVSQFTLHASTRKGNRPSFVQAAKPEQAKALYNEFVEALNTETKKPIQTGEFGAYMKIRILNDGPVTIIIDSKNNSNN